ncbi:MAG: hypothetical protein K1X94_14400 [Sandaracinaceae bacterium]|nr:hypothetical protein [Sandaracinaceae bacterium]
MSRALRETLEAFASEIVTSEILVNALADGGYQAAPERADDLEEFAQGPLRSEITAVLGGEVADAVIEGLGPVLLLMRRSERDTAVPKPQPPPLPHQRSSSGADPSSEVRPLRPVSRPGLAAAPSARPDLPPIPPARAAIPIPPLLLVGGRGRSPTSTPPARPATPSPHDEVPPVRRTQRERVISSAGLIDLAVVTGDPQLAQEASSRFAGRVVVGAALGELPRARVVLVDTRHALDELRTTWPVSAAPHVAVLWPADSRERALFEALQPHVPRVVCAGDEAELADVILLVTIQLTPSSP